MGVKTILFLSRPQINDSHIDNCGPTVQRSPQGPWHRSVLRTPSRAPASSNGMEQRHGATTPRRAIVDIRVQLGARSNQLAQTGRRNAAWRPSRRTSTESWSGRCGHPYDRMAEFTRITAPEVRGLSGVLSMPESDLDRFLNEVEECLRQSRVAVNKFDKRAWLELAEEWMKLARAVKGRGE